MADRDPKVTVLMPAYNAGPYIKEAINSVLNQTYPHFEFIIINDGSTDNTAEIIAEYSDARITPINQDNLGLVATLNKGLRLAKGEWIARFDADDVCHPNRLQVQIDFLRNNPGHVLVGSDADYMDKDGNYLFTFHCRAYADDKIREDNFKTCPLVHSSVLYKRDAVVAAGGYDEGALTFEDHLLWRKMAGQGKMANIAEPLIDVRFNPESVTVDEKWRGVEFNTIKAAAIKNGYISEADAARIREIVKSQDFKKFKRAAYYSMIGKKYLWNQYKPNEARRNLSTAIRIMPFKAGPYLLFLLSFLPERMIANLYKRFKKA